MKIGKILIFAMVVGSLLIISTASVTAVDKTIEDAEDDVVDIEGELSNYPNIDIKELTYTKEGKKVTALRRGNSNILNVEHVFSYYSKNYKELFSKIKWVDGDILDYDSIYDIVDEIGEIYHLAAKVSFNPKDKELVKKINVQGTRNIVNVSLERKIQKLCYVSSIAAIGNSVNHEPAGEDNMPTKSSDIDVAKAIIINPITNSLNS